MKVYSGLLSIILGFTLLVTLPVNKAEATFLEAGTETTQVAHTGINTGGWLANANSWVMDRVEQLNQLTELITNNVFTEAIRGFNELMTAIQTDISEVLGTVETLLAAPMDLFSELMSLPMSIISQVQSIGGGFMGLYDQAMGMFNIVGSAQGLGEQLGSFGSLFTGGGGFRDAYDFKTKFSGLRTRMNADFLSRGQAERRDAMYRNWASHTDAAKFGGDSIQIQATTAEMVAALNQSMNRGQEFEAMDRLQEAADRLSAWEQSRARAAGSWNRGEAMVSSQFKF